MKYMRSSQIVQTLRVEQIQLSLKMFEFAKFRKAHYAAVVAGITFFFLEAHSKELSHCNQVLKNDDFRTVDGTPEKPIDDVTGLHYYNVYLNKRILHPACNITLDQPLRISFEKITKISGILINQNLRLGEQKHELIQPKLLRGTSSFECTHSGFSNISGLIYIKYSCPTQSFANAIEIRSLTPWTINLTSLQNPESWNGVEWLILLTGFQGCLPPGHYPGQSLFPLKTFYQPGENVTYVCDDGDFEIKSSDIVSCNQTGHWSTVAPLCVLQETRHKFDLLFVKPTAGIGMQNVSFIFGWPNQGFSKISKIRALYSVYMSYSDVFRTIDKNVVINVLSSSGILHTRRLEIMHNGELNRKTEGFFIEDLSIHTCKNCSVQITFLEYHWDFNIVSNVDITGSTNFGGYEKYRKLSKGFPPVAPYLGMPQSYLDYELVLNGSINALLRDSPCREGFELKEPNKNYCSINGTWIGRGFCECEVLRTKRPPEVSFATWKYVHDDTFHEIVYTCENGQTIYAKYDLKSDDWKIETDCQRGNESQDFVHRYLVIGAVGLLTFISLSAIAVACYMWQRSLKRIASPSMSPVSTGNLCGNKEHNSEQKLRCFSQLKQDEEDVYVEPLDFNVTVSGATETQNEHLYADVFTANPILKKNKLCTLEQKLGHFSQLQQENTYEEPMDCEPMDFHANNF